MGDRKLAVDPGYTPGLWQADLPSAAIKQSIRYAQ